MDYLAVALLKVIFQRPGIGYSSYKNNTASCTVQMTSESEFLYDLQKQLWEIYI